MKLIHMRRYPPDHAGRDHRRPRSPQEFRARVAHVLRDHHDAELMVITGDLSDWGEREDYQW